jgi:hypothetical protein
LLRSSPRIVPLRKRAIRYPIRLALAPSQTL